MMRRAAKHILRRASAGLLFGRMSSALLSKAVPLEWIGAHLAELLEQLDVNCVIDVGANTGQYALLLRDVGYTGRIVSFEPVKANVEQLHRLARRDPNWRIEPLALGEADGELSMNVTRWTVFSSLLAPGEESVRFGSGGVVDHTEAVPVRRLDSLRDRLFAGIAEPRVYLKLDTQGYDLRVLAGAAGILDRVVGLQSEVAMRPTYVGEPGFLESLEQLMALGFAVTGMFPVNRRPDLRINCFDCVMRRLDTEPLMRNPKDGVSEDHQSPTARAADADGARIE